MRIGLAFDLVPAAGLRWLVELRPRALFADAAFASVVAMLVGEDTFATFALRHGGIDPRAAAELVIAGVDDAWLALARLAVDPAEVEAAFAHRAHAGGSGPGYATIAAAGWHATILHWTRNDGPLRPGELIVIDCRVGHIFTKAIIDTGGQTTIGNIALRDELVRQNIASHYYSRPDEIVGATLAVQKGEIIATPAIEMGPLQIKDSGVTYADVYIFKHWKYTDEPAIMIGMDALGTLDTLIIDYRRKELQIRTKAG